jgi:hypothetical protein
MISKAVRGGIAIFIGIVIMSCSKEKEVPEDNQAKLIFSFDHTINGNPVIFDSLMYENDAGNPFLVNEIQYFVSDVRLYSGAGDVKLIDDWKAIHYVDTDIPYTQSWEVYDPIDPGQYDSISFTFGISADKNMSFMYVNPPEKDMFWPEFLGGGYHYMKLNGKWLPEGQLVQTAPFDFHLGIGQVYYSYPDSITGFIHNNFDVSLPGSAFDIGSGEKKTLKITMQVDKWFNDPHVYDHDVYGGYIMQNQEAMKKVKENGHNVFLLDEIEEE